MHLTRALGFYSKNRNRPALDQQHRAAHSNGGESLLALLNGGS